MPSNTAFGPQTRNAVSSLPSGTTANRYGSTDTWFQDCQDTTNPDGTVANAAWFNMVTGNLRYLIQQANTDGASITLDDGDMTLVLQAVKYYAENSGLQSVNTAHGLTNTNGVVGIDFPVLEAFV